VRSDRRRAPRAARSAEPAPRRDPIGFLLLYRMEWCERHPGVMFAALGALIVLAGVLEKVMP
jgi:hypothetical protein